MSSTTIIIFGATGDLTHRKLGPALFSSFAKGRLPERTRIVGFARREWDHDHFRETMQKGIQEFTPDVYSEEKWAEFASDIWYSRGNLDDYADFASLNTFLEEIEGEAANRLYYLATSPEFFVPVIEHLHTADMVQEANGWRRIIIEKPFGTDLESARALNTAVHAVFEEHQVYRIDHYLGKETAQNILFFRFANAIFEPVWNRRYVDHVQLTVTETVDVGQRAGYYDSSGVLRDMFQNHILQLMSLVGMEPPSSFEADAVRNEKSKLLSAVRPVDPADTVRAQYEGYSSASGVAEDSHTPTYAALKLYIDNWRWKGVPFYLRSGKALKAKVSEVAVVFQRPPHVLFDREDETIVRNAISLCIQPDEGIHLSFETKVPDSVQDMQSVDMEFHYQDAFDGALPDAYERLLLDALKGDASLFTRGDGIEYAWKIIDPVLKHWASSDVPPLELYRRGSWGPTAAETLLTRDGRGWRQHCWQRKNKA